MPLCRPRGQRALTTPGDTERALRMPGLGIALGPAVASARVVRVVRRLRTVGGHELGEDAVRPAG